MAYRQWTKADLDRCPLAWDARQLRNRVERALARGAAEHEVTEARARLAEIEAEIAAREAAR